jgi:hypothetical protein
MVRVIIETKSRVVPYPAGNGSVIASQSPSTAEEEKIA